MNGDTASEATTGLPALSTPANASSASGTYPITANAGTLASQNYDPSYFNGIMAVRVRAVNFIGDSQTHGSISGNCQHSWPKPGVPACWTNLVQEQSHWDYGRDISEDGNRWGRQLMTMFQAESSGGRDSHQALA